MVRLARQIAPNTPATPIRISDKEIPRFGLFEARSGNVVLLQVLCNVLDIVMDVWIKYGVYPLQNALWRGSHDPCLVDQSLFRACEKFLVDVPMRQRILDVQHDTSRNTVKTGYLYQVT